MKIKSDTYIYYSNISLTNKSVKFENRVRLYLSLYVFLSGFVFIEPSPAELLFLIFFTVSIFKIEFDKQIFLLTLLLLIPCFISVYIGQTFFYLLDLRFFLIDIYLFFFFLITASYLKKISYSKNLLSNLMFFWTLAGLINILAGIISVSNNGKLFGIDVLVFGLRLKGFFKDPNVLGPFLTPPALYFLNRTIKSRRKFLVSFFLFIILSFGVLFTFSRAAWLNYTTSFLLLILIKFFKPKELKKLLLVISILSIVTIIFWELSYSIELMGFNLQNFFLGRVGLKSYDQDRFEAQKGFSDILKSTSILFGTGPGNYETFTHMATHSLYARYIGERGLFGFLLFGIFLSILLVKSTKSKFSELLFPIIIGQMVNSLFIDSLHWRHLWILLSLVFIKDRNYT